MKAIADGALACGTWARAEPREAAPEPADAELVRQALDGTNAAAALLAARYRGRLYAFALALLRHADDAEDVAQEALVRAFGALASYRGDGTFRAWLFRIAANLCRDRQRRSPGRPVELEAVERDPPASGAADLCEQVALRTAVFAAVRRLPITYRAPVVLHYMEGLSVAETAAALGRSRTAVRVQLWRARNRLADELAGWQAEEGR
jgi:RNA polymerase sigma-70 factor (ECF subfamily)